MVAGSSQRKAGFAGRASIKVIEKARQVLSFPKGFVCPRLDSFFLTVSDDLIKDITFTYKSCLLYTFRASHFQRAYHSSSIDKAAIKGYDEHFFMSFFFLFVLFSWCSCLTTSLVSLDVLDVLVWSLVLFCCSASKHEVASRRASLECSCPVFGTRTPLNLQHGFVCSSGCAGFSLLS